MLSTSWEVANGQVEPREEPVCHIYTVTLESSSEQTRHHTVWSGTAVGTGPLRGDSKLAARLKSHVHISCKRSSHTPRPKVSSNFKAFCHHFWCDPLQDQPSYRQSNQPTKQNFCSFIESQVLEACPGHQEHSTFDPFRLLMPDAGMIPSSVKAMPRLSGLPCVQFSQKVLSSPIWVTRDIGCGHCSLGLCATVIEKH